MKLVRNYPVCDGCIHSELFKCTKFNEKCPSFMFGEKRYQTACLSCLNDDSYEFGLPSEEKNDSNSNLHNIGIVINKLGKRIYT